MSSTETPDRVQKLSKRLLPTTPVGKPLPKRAVSHGNQHNLSTVSQTSIAEAGAKLSPANGRRTSLPVSASLVVPEGEDSSITVAVRMRPFSEREQCLEARQVVWITGNEVVITSKEKEDTVVHRFGYDHCFCRSPDSSLSDSDDQEQVYKSLGRPLLDRSFEGYNTCLFAYGQTGSGKSYCMMGEKDAPGMVPRFTKELYERIDQMTTAESNVIIKVQVSFYEIYNEKIFDLLASTKAKNRPQLRVREHPIMGPYVEDLAMYAANSYSDIEHWLNLGNRFRATAATGMNDRSSRSHSVFTILLTQTVVSDEDEHSKVSRINLIDLAGSERSSVSLTSGDRLKEGASINRSLHTLGKVISLLSERSAGRRKKVFIPYRDSTLTWLLKESLGGNSKTTMIATISPSDIHHAESLSTLRYAQKARSIVNVARINEDPNAQIIRELRQEIEHLRTLLAQTSDPSSSLAEIKTLREQLKESEKLMDQATRSWKDQQEKTEARKLEELERLKREALYADSGLPTLVNLNEDPQLSEKLLYALKEGPTTVGSDLCNDIQLTGVMVAQNHCTIHNEIERVTLQPYLNTDLSTYVNGHLVSAVTVLHHGDRIIFGGEYFFRFNHPREVEKGTTLASNGGFEFARNEFVQAQTERLEAELEAKRAKEREEMMNELQAIKEAAQREIEAQKGQFQEHLEMLSSKMQEQTIEMQQHQQSEQEAQSKIEELRKRNQLLEEETMEQRHIIRLEQLKMQKEYEEVKEHKTRLMMELEQEKKRLEEDIANLNKNSVLRQNTKITTTTARPETPDMNSGSQQVLRLAMMLQEANAICKALSKPLTLSREEAYDQGEMKVYIRVTNSQNGTATLWDVNKFELRLEQMRDMYQLASFKEPDPEQGTPGLGCGNGDPATDGSVNGELTSDETRTSTDVDPVNDPFNNPSDEWIATSPLLHSPLRTTQLCRSLLSSPMLSSLTSSSGRAKPCALSSFPKSLADMLSGGSHNGSPGLLSSPVVPDSPLSVQWRYPPQSQASHPFVRWCHDHLVEMLTSKESPPPSVCEQLLHYIGDLQASCIALAGIKTATSGVLEEPSDFSHHVMMLCVSLERLLVCAKMQCACCHTMEVTPSGEKGPLEQCCYTILDTLQHQTTLYCSKLLQGIEDKTEQSIQMSSESVLESLNVVTSLVGQLSIGTCVQEHSMQNISSPPIAALLKPDFFLANTYNSLICPFYRGYYQWCIMVIERTLEISQTHLKHLIALSEDPTVSPFHKDLHVKICHVMRTIQNFMQNLAAMQVPIWSLDDSTPDDLPLPALPDNGRVVDMLLCIHKVQKGQAALFDQGLQLCKETPRPEQLLAAIKQAVLACSELSVCLLSIIKGLSLDKQELADIIQSLSHGIAQAGKSLSHLVKSGPSVDTAERTCFSDPAVI